MASARKSEGLSISWKQSGECLIRFAEDLFAEGNPLVAETLRAVTGAEKPRVLLVADTNVVQRTEGLGTKIGRYVQAYSLELAGAPVVLGGGEKIKFDNRQSVQRVLDALAESHLGVKDVVVAIGGGTLLDVAGFAAGQICGGLKFVCVPTTVAAMIDGAFMEWAAIDGVKEKDALRIPCRPSAVLIDTSFARTVLDGVWRGGLGELVREAAVLDGTLFKKIAKQAEVLRNRDGAVLAEMVRACVETRVKKGATDFALWSALRLETMSSYKLPHGYAVPIGVAIDCAYAEAKGLLKKADRELICGTLATCGALDGLAHSYHLLSQPDSILEGLEARLRATGSKQIVLPAALGKSTVEEDLDTEIFRQVLKTFLTVPSAS